MGGVGEWAGAWGYSTVRSNASQVMVSHGTFCNCEQTDTHEWRAVKILLFTFLPDHQEEHLQGDRI